MFDIDRLSASVYSDQHITGRHGFLIYDDMEEVFDSQLIYSSQEDASRAAEDAVSVAHIWGGIVHAGA